jgi:uncharacterized protein YbjT (DUF2867 family)
MLEPSQVLVTGATGFVGSQLAKTLQDAGFSVVCGSRRPDKAERRFAGRTFRALDVRDFDSTVKAMQGCQAAVYLVHSMADGRGYERVEQRSAATFARAAAKAGLSRIVYLGGIQPQGKPSRHLRSRLRVGAILRAGSVCTIELQASMIIGAGSESWRMVRDLAARLPVMILPGWLESKSQPIYIDDVTAAIQHALRLESTGSAAYPLPGPEVLTAREIIARTAGLLGLRPRMLRLPILTPRLSSYWIALITRANPNISRQLVEGLRTDLVAPDDGFWKLLPGYVRVPFDEAARRALLAEAKSLSLRSRFTEWLIHRLTPAEWQVAWGDALGDTPEQKPSGAAL